MLIRDASLWLGPRADVRIQDGRIAAIGMLVPALGERVVEAGGGALLPGLHDHHVHLAATAVAMRSTPCGPPHIRTRAELSDALRVPGKGWLRGIGYHESVAGMLDRKQLDAWQPDRPVRIQHRSGRMWFLNSCALEVLQAQAELPAGLDIASGHLFDEDNWLRTALASRPPQLDEVSSRLARFGVTGVTEISPSNGEAEAEWLDEEFSAGRLLQHCVIAGRPELSNIRLAPGLALGAVKIHLHEHALCDFDAMVATIREAHWSGRPVAVHCTTEVELVFALSAIEAAEPLPGDRIEHAGIASDELIAQVAQLGLHVVSQPHFIAERGDHYLDGVEARQRDWLYRLDGFARAGVTLATGSDAPYGTLDPWAAMRSACSRRTASGRIVGASEALAPERAIALYLADPLDLTRQRGVEVGANADLCLLDRPWDEGRKLLDAAMVRATLIGGRLVHDRVDQAPVERRLCANPAA